MDKIKEIDLSKYIGGALDDEEARAFIAKYNKRAERRCIVCTRKFTSPGAHIRKCRRCKKVEQTRSQHNAEFEESFTCKSHHPGAIIPKDTDSELIRGLVTAWLPF